MSSSGSGGSIAARLLQGTKGHNKTAAAKAHAALILGQQGDHFPLFSSTHQITGPGDLVSAGEEGEVISLLPKDQRGVRFRRGSFVVPLSALQETGSD